jgi:hypothetical protein
MRRRKSLVSSRQPIHACANSVMRIARLGVATMHTRRHGMLSTACNVLQPEIACASDGKESTLQVHMLHFESRPGFFVTAGLWVPAASAPGVDPVTGKRAGVLYASGHSCQAWRRRDEPDVYTYQYTVSAASTTRVRARAHARVCMCVCVWGGGSRSLLHDATLSHLRAFLKSDGLAVSQHSGQESANSYELNTTTLHLGIGWLRSSRH